MRFIVTRDGQIEHASAPGLRWLTISGNRERLRALVPGPDGEVAGTLSFDLIPLFEPEAQAPEAPRYLITLRLTEPALDALSPRLREVAEYAIVGATCREIATQLGIREATVREYMKAIYRRLGVASRVELANLLRPTPK